MPSPGDSIRTTMDENHILTLWLDVPGKSVNTITPAVLSQLADALAAIDRDRPAGLIITSAKPHRFCAGADLSTIESLDHDTVMQFIATGEVLFNQIASLPIPTVAAINGDALGGGLELAFACRHRIAADEAGIRIGLPEVKLALIPAWGATARLPRLIGQSRAFALLMNGNLLSPPEAKKFGMVGEIAPPGSLHAAATRWILHSARSLPRISPSAAVPASRPNCRFYSKSTRPRSLEDNPARQELFHILRRSCTIPIVTGLAAECEAIARLIRTPQCRELLRQFFTRHAAKHANSAVDTKSRARRVLPE